MCSAPFLLRRLIKLSSPKLNNTALVGCLLVYAGIIVLAASDHMLKPTLDYVRPNQKAAVTSSPARHVSLFVHNLICPVRALHI